MGYSLMFCLREGSCSEHPCRMTRFPWSLQCGVARHNGLGPRLRFEHTRLRMICLMASVMRVPFRGRSARKGEIIRSHLRFRWIGNQCALAIQPVAALLTELL